VHTFFISPTDRQGQIISISDDKKAHHIRKVLRLKPGERIRVCDGRGNAYLCCLTGLSPKVTLRVEDTLDTNQTHRKTYLTVACAIPKKSSMDDIIDKLTQLGVDEIIPLITERVVVKLKPLARTAKHARWQKKALAASEQSQRTTLVTLAPVSTLEDALEYTQGYSLKLIPTLENPRVSLREACGISPASRVVFFIGPEGDFTDRDVARAQTYGCIPVSLGNQVLRVETAAVAVASFIQFLFQAG
jgi:16S rRNA (uracil1498-N3)-methyltransferase